MERRKYRIYQQDIVGTNGIYHECRQVRSAYRYCGSEFSQITQNGSQARDQRAIGSPPKCRYRTAYADRSSLVLRYGSIQFLDQLNVAGCFTGKLVNKYPELIQSGGNNVRPIARQQGFPRLGIEALRQESDGTVAKGRIGSARMIGTTNRV